MLAILNARYSMSGTLRRWTILLIAFIGGAWLICVPPDWYNIRNPTDAVTGYHTSIINPHFTLEILIAYLCAFIFIAILGFLYGEIKSWIPISMAGSLFSAIYLPVFSLLGGFDFRYFIFFAVPALFCMASFTGNKVRTVYEAKR
jgi:hypothetical protein